MQTAAPQANPQKVPAALTIVVLAEAGLALRRARHRHRRVWGHRVLGGLARRSPVPVAGGPDPARGDPPAVRRKSACPLKHEGIDQEETDKDERKREHHLLQRPRNAPTRTALFVSLMTFYGLLWAAGGNDILDGGRGNDKLSGSSGNDTLDGGLGVDVADYSALKTAITIALDKLGDPLSGPAGDAGDTLTSLPWVSVSFTQSVVPVGCAFLMSIQSRTYFEVRYFISVAPASRVKAGPRVRSTVRSRRVSRSPLPGRAVATRKRAYTLKCGTWAAPLTPCLGSS